MIEAYKHYREYGLCMLPLRKKIPALAKGQSWKNGITDESLYVKADSIGLICGSVSGNTEAIDFDNHFGDADRIFNAFLANEDVAYILSKNKIPVQSTPSGGYHVIYRCSDIGNNDKLAQGIRNGKVDTLIETRGEGGYIAIYPSAGYNFTHNPLSIKNIPVITPAERTVLIEHCCSFNEHFVEVQKKKIYTDDVRPGDFYNSQTDAVQEAKDALREYGWVELQNNRWRRPDKKEGVSATFGVVGENKFYVFSSSVFPFEPMTSYLPFAIISILRYDGDYSAFAMDISHRYNLTQKVKPIETVDQARENESEQNELSEKLLSVVMDADKVIEKPAIIMSIKSYDRYNPYESRLLTRGNISVIKGKQKTKKSFFTTMLLATMCNFKEMQTKFVPRYPDEKEWSVLFDTEQSEYDAVKNIKRIKTLTGVDNPPVKGFMLRRFMPKERMQLIEHALHKMGNAITFVVIDGVVDLVKANDEENAIEVVNKLMNWTTMYNLHICCVIHENKADSNATGHLGSYLVKKAETVIQIEKDDVNVEPRWQSKVKCHDIRGTVNFNDFNFHIDDNGLPLILDQINFIPAKDVI